MEVKSLLRPNCLNFWELLAQAIALISPTMTAALIVPLMFGTTHNLSWLAYAFGTVMLLLVSLNINQFAKRSTQAGSMYAYTSRGLGPTMGGISGWCLIWAYQSIGVAGLTGFTVFSTKLLGMCGMNTDTHPVVLAVVLFASCVALVWFFAWKDIQFSTILMLVLEGISMLFIVVLCAIVLGKHHFALDTTQFTFKDASLKDMGLGVVVAIFSLVGFECATAFGEEAKNPLKTIPRAVIASLIVTGLFFVLVTYVEVQDLRDNNSAARSTRCAVEHDGGVGAREVDGADRLDRGDAELFLAGAELHERGKPDHVRDGPPRDLSSFDGQIARNQRDAARRRVYHCQHALLLVDSDAGAVQRARQRRQVQRGGAGHLQLGRRDGRVRIHRGLLPDLLCEAGVPETRKAASAPWTWSCASARSSACWCPPSAASIPCRPSR